MSTSSAADRAHAADAFAPYSLNAVLAENWWAVALRGVLGIAFGLIALFLPGATMLSLVLVFAAYMLVDGVFAIVAAVRAARQHERWGLLTFEGIADIVTAVIAVVWPGITVLAFVLLVAAWAIVSGCLMTAAAFHLDMEHGRGWLIFGGLVSVAYGVVLVIAPLIGALVLTWWLGAYALVFGVALLVLAFKLRSRRARSHAAMA
ncbi:MAG: HdeD family acid-resistance protein [Bradyrhizobium sp.]